MTVQAKNLNSQSVGTIRLDRVKKKICTGEEDVALVDQRPLKSDSDEYNESSV
jgi:hypothetical protein